MASSVLLSAAMETVLLVLVCAAPWCYGCVHPGFELLLFAGVSLVVVLWGVRMLLEGRLSWKNCPVTLCLAGLFLLGVWQTMPLSKPVLARLSFATSCLYDQLLPQQPEALAGEDESGLAAMPRGETISLYPAATRKQLLRLLAVFLVFAAVRNNITSEAGLRRLSIAVLVNGAALSLFALVQFFSSPPNVLYWRYPSLGHVFGPFICRNHFPFYVNLCIGLGVGLLLNRLARIANGRCQPAEAGRSLFGRSGLSRLTAPLSLLNDPPALWICTALALMLGAVAFSLSRGGVLALAGGAFMCLLLKRSPSTPWTHGGAALVITALAVMLGSWLGLGLVGERLATLWRGEALQSRLPLWIRTAPLAKDFPVWGTGYGTFSYAERLYQNSAADAESACEYAHNDYLEMLIEGGMPGLLLSLIAIGLVFRLGCRTVRCCGSRAGGWLALGALFAFTTLVIQSFGDFGIHIPAITLLATVLSAHLCGLGDGDRSGSCASIGASEYRLRFGGLAPLLGAGTSVFLGLLLCAGGCWAYRIDCLRLAAARGREGAGANGLAVRVACLEKATRLDPENAELQVELGQARLGLFECKTAQLEQRSKIAAVAEAVVAARGDLAAILGWSLAGAAERAFTRVEQKRLECEYLFLALRNYCNARDRCPLLSEPHMVLATQATRLSRANSCSAYLERVKLLSAGDPEAWYLCGVQELWVKQPERAWVSWRHCLELSDRYLPQILEAAARHFSPGEMIEILLPDRPALLLAAALRLYPEAGATGERRPFLQKAVLLLENRPGTLKPEDLRVKAMAYKFLGQPDKAIAAYQQLLSRQPAQAKWRYELAQILHEQGRLEDARRELVVVLAQQPTHVQSRELLAVVSFELVRKR